MEIPHPFLTAATTAQLQLDGEGRLAEDIPCRKCAYNLRGLSPEGRCPECGTAVGLSTLGDLLRFADPDWLRTVARGITILLWMILVMLLAECITRAAHLGNTVDNVVSIALNLISLYGAWLMTEPDPSGIGEDPTFTARKLIRFTLLVGVVLQFPALVATLTDVPAPLLVVLGLLMLTAILTSLIGEFAKFVYFEHLFRRVPDRRLADRARWLKWGYVVCLGTSMLSGLIVMLVFNLAGAGANSAVAVGALLMIPTGIALLVFAIMTIVLLLRLRRALLDAAARAETIWRLAGPVATLR